MDVSTADAVLGLKPDPSLDEAKKVFDARANRLQPERAKASLQPAAKSAVAEANEAGMWRAGTWPQAVGR